MQKKYLLLLGVIAFVIAIGVLSLYVKSELPHIITPGAAAPGALGASISLKQDGFLTYSNAQSLVEYALMAYNFSNGTYANVSLTVYQEKPIVNIYLVNASQACLNCFPFPTVRTALQNALTEYGLIINVTSMQTVQLSGLQGLPRDSVIVMPTGLLPLAVTPGAAGSTFTIANLLANGDTIIYVGRNFSDSVSSAGQITINSPQTTAAIQGLGLTQGQISAKSTFTPAGIPLFFNSSARTFEFAQGSLYGPIPYATAGNGTVVAFTNYPTSAWSTSAQMASDIAAAIDARFWMTPIAYGRSVLNFSMAKRSGVYDEFTVGQPFLGSSLGNVYSLLNVKLHNATGFLGKNIEFSASYLPNGTVAITPQVGQTQAVPISLEVNLRTPTLQSPHIDIYDSNFTYLGSIPVSSFNSSAGIEKIETFYLTGGYHILMLRDFNDRFYSGALFDIANTTITPLYLSFNNGTFAFQLTSLGLPIGNTSYTLSLNGEYPQQGTITDGTVVYDLPKGSLVSYGNQQFTLGVFGSNIVANYPYPSPSFYIQPIYIEFAIAAVVIILLNIILQPPNRDDYYIDVPTLPPVKKTPVSIGADIVLGVFDKVNFYYRWRYMPLTAEEVKAGISNNVRVNNVPIAITLQNTVNVMSVLVAKGMLVTSMDYYAPKKWMDDSKHDIEYLVVFRKLRDYCVSHATLFTDLDTNATCDMQVTKSGSQSLVYIYSRGSKLKEMKVTDDSRIFVVFINEEARLAFMDRLYASYGEQAEVLKTGIAYSYIRLIDAEHLDQLIV